MKIITKIIPLRTDFHVVSRYHLPPEAIGMIQTKINYSMILFTNGNKVIVST